MGELLLGILCGIVLSLFFSFGPAFFSQIRTSIQYGYRKSYPFAFGVSVGDIIIVFLMLTVLKNVNLYELLHNVWVASIGGAVLVVMGIYFLRKEVTSLEDEEKHIKFKSKDGDPRRRTIFMQGFVINIVNPLIWIYWVSVIALLTGELNLTVLERYIFFLGVLGYDATLTKQTASTEAGLVTAYLCIDMISFILSIILLLRMDVEKHIEEDKAKILRRQKEAVLAEGGIWIEPEERARIEQEKQDREAEEVRVAELKLRCREKGLDFEEENNKYLKKQEMKKNSLIGKILKLL